MSLLTPKHGAEGVSSGTLTPVGDGSSQVKFEQYPSSNIYAGSDVLQLHRITSIPSNFHPDVQTVSIKDSDFESLVTCNFSYIKVLKIENTVFRQHLLLSCLPSLQELRIENSSVKQLAVNDLQNLTVLHCEGNFLSQLKVTECNKIEKVIVRDNPSLSSITFIGLNSLKHLYLGKYTKISSSNDVYINRTKIPLVSWQAECVTQQAKIFQEAFQRQENGHRSNPFLDSKTRHLPVPPFTRSRDLQPMPAQVHIGYVSEPVPTQVNIDPITKFLSRCRLLSTSQLGPDQQNPEDLHDLDNLRGVADQIRCLFDRDPM